MLFPSIRGKRGFLTKMSVETAPIRYQSILAENIDLSKGWYCLLAHDSNQQVWNITQTLFATADKSPG